MKTNLIKKAFASLTAIITVSGITSSFGTFAANSNVRDRLPAHKLETSMEVATIPIKKDIVIFNPTEKYIYEPNMIYTYEVSSANVTNAQISTVDSNDAPQILTVYPGVIEAITSITDNGLGTDSMTGNTTKTATITFGNDNTSVRQGNTTASGIEIRVDADHKFTHQMDIKIDASKIYKPDDTTVNAPGVYRYKIEDVTTAATFTQSGVTDGGAGNVIYLDVYTKNKPADAGEGLLIYGYVLVKGTEENGNISITYNTEEDDGVKIDGFVSSSEGDTDNSQTILPADFKVDSYHTYNVRIENRAAGDLADRTHEFPLTVTLSNENIRNAADFDVNNGADRYRYSLDAEDGSWSSLNVAGNTVDFTLKHGQFINVIGIPVGTKVSVKEENNTTNTYAISASGNESPLDLIEVNADAEGKSLSILSGSSAMLKVPFSVASESRDDNLVITNTLRDISVTGLIFDIAPFIFITLAGIALLVLCLKNRKKNNAGNNI